MKPHQAVDQFGKFMSEARTAQELKSTEMVVIAQQKRIFELESRLLEIQQELKHKSNNIGEGAGAGAGADHGNSNKSMIDLLETVHVPKSSMQPFTQNINWLPAEFDRLKGAIKRFGGEKENLEAVTRAVLYGMVCYVRPMFFSPLSLHYCWGLEDSFSSGAT